MKYSRGFLIAASAYKRMCPKNAHLDFSEDSLREQFQYETSGKGFPDPKKNGYTLGKWVLDATLKAMREDHAHGLFTKYELSKGSCYFVRRAIARWPPAVLFSF